MIPVMLLTAGLGTRLDPLTRLVAKPALPVGGRSLVEIILRWLRAQGTERAVLNLHHLPASIAERVGDGSHLGVAVRYSWEHPLLGSAGGPRRALPLLDSETFLIVNGDTVCEIDLAPMIEAHEASGADVTMALAPNHAPDRYNGLRLSEDGHVVGWEPRGRAGDTWHFVGVQVVRSRVFSRVADGVPAETVSGIYRDLMTMGGRRILGWPVESRFFDVGTPRDYFDAALAWHSEDDAVFDTDLESIVWPGAVVEPGADLRQCIVAGDVRVPRDLRARSSILVPASLVRHGDRAHTVGDVAMFPFDR